jgi:hypothetical protein
VQVDELAPGLWRWTAEHPEWRHGDSWDAEVACFYAELDAATVLVDPLVPAGEDGGPFWAQLDADVRRRGLPVAVLLTSEWHRRSADEVAARYGATISGELPDGVEARGAGEGETALWLAAHRALAVGDALISVGGELRLWVAATSPEPVRALLDLPIEHVLVGHGDHVPGGRAAIEAALAREPYGG